jgi:Flp pilus assembly pilin Flp
MRLVTNLGNCNHKGQSLIEYAMVAAIVTAAVVAMSTYVFRSVQATQQMIQKEFRGE